MTRDHETMTDEANSTTDAILENLRRGINRHHRRASETENRPRRRDQHRALADAYDWLAGRVESAACRPEPRGETPETGVDISADGVVIVEDRGNETIRRSYERTGDAIAADATVREERFDPVAGWVPVGGDRVENVTINGEAMFGEVSGDE